MSNLTLLEKILYCLALLEKKRRPITFERLVAECFKNYPSSFCLKRYPKWPDSLRLDRQLRTLRQKGLITGAANDYIRISEAGKNYISKFTAMASVAKDLSQNSLRDSSRSPDDKTIVFLKNHTLFKDYKKDNQISIKDNSIRDFLRGTMETPRRILLQNLNHYKHLAKLYKEHDLLKLLNLIEDKII